MRSAPPETTNLLHLHQEVVVTEMALDVESVRQLNLTCRHFSFFNMRTPLRMAYQLLDCVDRADWAAAAQIVQQFPEAMFVEVFFRRLNLQRERTTAVMLAFKLVDTKMSRLLWEAAQVDPAYAARYQLQANEQQAVMTMTLLTDAYQAYEMAHRLWIRNLAPEADKLNAWARLSQAQMLCVPVHLLKIWCAASNLQTIFDWGSVNALAVAQSDGDKIYLYDRTRMDFQTYFDQAERDGDRYVLMRGRNNASLDLLTYQQSGNRGGHHVLQYDYKGLLTLYEMKLTEQIAFRAELNALLKIAANRVG
jgi:hypothetical protein